MESTLFFFFILWSYDSKNDLFVLCLYLKETEGYKNLGIEVVVSNSIQDNGILFFTC